MSQPDDIAAKAAELFDNILEPMGEYAEWMRPSAKSEALEKIKSALRNQIERYATIAEKCDVPRPFDGMGGITHAQAFIAAAIRKEAL